MNFLVFCFLSDIILQRCDNVLLEIFKCNLFYSFRPVLTGGLQNTFFVVLSISRFKRRVQSQTSP